MAKVYIVTSGSYSDYSVEAVFDEDHEKEAKVYRDTLYDGDILEMELNGELELAKMLERGFRPFSVTMNEDGTLFSAIEITGMAAEQTRFMPFVNPNDTSKQILRLYIIRWAKQKEDVIKIANEIRTVYRGLNMWGKDFTVTE